MLAMTLAVLAAALHVFIWYLEAFAWTGRARAVFGTTVEEAEATREMAFNQGFYNLFLALIALAGVVCRLTGRDAAGQALIFAGTGSMLAAAVLLLATSSDKRAAAVKQGTLPLLAIVTLLISL